MNEIKVFLKSLLSRKFLLAVAVFAAANQATIPAKYKATLDVVIAGLYFVANVTEKKVN